MVKIPPEMQVTQEMWVQSLDREDPLEEEMATHFNILGWRTPWTEEPAGLGSGYSLWGCKESHMTEGLSTQHTHASILNPVASEDFSDLVWTYFSGFLVISPSVKSLLQSTYIICCFLHTSGGLHCLACPQLFSLPYKPSSTCGILVSILKSSFSNFIFKALPYPNFFFLFDLVWP